MKKSNLKVYLVLLLALFLPISVLGWGGRLHIDISRRAAQIVPEEMAAWRAYANLMANGSFRPDLWKGDDQTEGPRHYVDIERYAEIGAKNLPRNYADLSRMTSRRHTPRSGIAPWVILELQERLTAAMATNDWDEAAVVAAAMGHYVADVHQPLHTTENFDGATGEGRGVHLRWEIEMPGIYWRTSMLAPDEPNYVEDAWPFILGFIKESHEDVNAILDADEKARAATGGNTESRAYYGKLWELSEDIFVRQASLAARNLASLWYTAWMDAGRPKIPRPQQQISEATIWRQKPPQEVPSAWPFFIAFITAAIVIVWLSARKKKPA